MRDILWAFNMVPSGVSQQGAQIGAVFGVMIRSVILGAISLALYRYGKSILHPDTYSQAARLRAHIKKIYATEALQDYEFSHEVLDSEYQSFDDGSLLEIYDRIDRNVVPDKYDQLLYAIKSRVEKGNPEEGQPDRAL